VGEEPALADSPLGSFLAAAGFVRAGPGYRLHSMPSLPSEDEEGDLG
jgi:hypothetical protein